MYQTMGWKKEEEEKTMNEKGNAWGLLLGFVSVILSVITLSVCLSIRASLGTVPTVFNADGPTDQTDSEKAEPIGYVGIRGEKIVILSDAGDVVRELSADPAFLPDSEREELEKGIAVFSPEELYLVAENYID